MIRFLIFILTMCLFSACQEKTPQHSDVHSNQNAIKEAATKIGDMIPRIVKFPSNNILDGTKKLDKIGMMINGIGYPTRIGLGDTIQVNIAGLASDRHAFKAKVFYQDGTEIEHQFYAKIDESTVVVVPVINVASE